MSATTEIQRKHELQIKLHEESYGAPLGQLKTEPTQEKLDRDFSKRESRGDLFTQQQEKALHIKDGIISIEEAREKVLGPDEKQG